jgi:hypothetical protein
MLILSLVHYVAQSARSVGFKIFKITIGQDHQVPGQVNYTVCTAIYTGLHYNDLPKGMYVTTSQPSPGHTCHAGNAEVLPVGLVGMVRSMTTILTILEVLNIVLIMGTLDETTFSGF